MEQRFPFQPSPLPYNYIALMPYCDADTLYYHHNDYYADAVHTLNNLVVRHRLTQMDLEQLIQEDIQLPTAQLDRLKSAAGAIYNHQLYFQGIVCKAGPPPFNRLTSDLIATYGSMPAFQQLFVEAAESIIGSGWVWLIAEGNKGLHIATTANNDVVDLASVTPVMVLDMWEHAYIPVDHFDKAAYVNDWFSLINWDVVEERYLSALTRVN